MKRLLITQKFFLFILGSLMLGCSAEKTNVFSTTYHNTTAHYNAYFIAREQISEIENAIFENHKENYNDILIILPEIDTTYTRTFKDELEDVIKKASLPIQLHKNSKWVDDSYVLIGKARLYSGDYINAIETFKFVNTKGEDDDARHEALINLMRTFIQYNEYNNAIAVADFLKKEKLNGENLHDFYQMNAYLYQLMDDYQNMIAYLNETIPLSKKTDRLARKYFIAGQVYQKFNYDSAAYSNYQKCIRSNPTYELSFYAKLYMAQVTQLAKTQNVKKVRKYFKKLLKDKKNKEYRDKIYYEQAKFEVKQNDYQLAVQNLRQSVAVSESNQRQKAYSYLMLGEIYYDHFKDFSIAKAYYDSVMTVLPSDDERYASIKERQNILKEFVENYNTIQEQDSLLELASLDKQKLDLLLEEVVAKMKTDKEEKAKEEKKMQRRQSSGIIDEDAPFAATQNTGEGGTWYFYNSSAIASGRNEFIRKWGNRPLEDNWRRSQKSSSYNVDELSENDEQTEPIDSAAVAQNESFSEEAEKKALLATIPFTPEEKQQALDKIEVAHYNLGNIYYLKLHETGNAVTTFENLIRRFPESEYTPEVLYQLYLIYGQQGGSRQEFCKNELLTRYPDTDFAKLIENPNYYADRDATSNRLQKLYDIAYGYFDSENYDQASLMVSRALDQYPDNPFSDHLRILDIMIAGKLEGISKYQFQLQQFIDQNPDSELKGYAENLLAASRRLQEAGVKLKGITYIGELDLEHFYIATYSVKGNVADKLAEAIDVYMKKEFSSSGLNIGNLTLDEGVGLVLVNQFSNREKAEQFLKRINGAGSPLKDFAPYNVEDFIITKENFEILYKTKGLKEYKEFYQEHYK